MKNNLNASVKRYSLVSELALAIPREKAMLNHYEYVLIEEEYSEDCQVSGYALYRLESYKDFSLLSTFMAKVEENETTTVFKCLVDITDERDVQWANEFLRIVTNFKRNSMGSTCYVDRLEEIIPYIRTYLVPSRAELIRGEAYAEYAFYKTLGHERSIERVKSYMEEMGLWRGDI